MKMLLDQLKVWEGKLEEGLVTVTFFTDGSGYVSVDGDILFHVNSYSDAVDQVRDRLSSQPAAG